MMIYVETEEAKAWTYWGVSFGLGGFMLGFFFDFYSVSWAEVLASIPLAIFLLKTIDE